MSFLLLILMMKSFNPTFRSISAPIEIASASARGLGEPNISTSHWVKYLYRPYCGSSYLQLPPIAAYLMGSGKSDRFDTIRVRPTVKSNLRPRLRSPLSLNQ